MRHAQRRQRAPRALIAEVLESGQWEGAGILSREHWVAWKTRVAPDHARRLVMLARRVSELPATQAALERGQLTEDQAAVVAQHVPALHHSAFSEAARR